MLVKSRKKAVKIVRDLPNYPKAEEAVIAEPIFLPPEEVAAQENAEEPNRPIPQPPKKASWWKRTPKKKKLLILVPCAVVVLLLISLALYLLVFKKDKPVVVSVKMVAVVQKAPPPIPTTIASKLTGLQITPELNKRGVTAIMIENSIDARPQSGLLEAGVIYEAIAEGGITRFVALFQESQPDSIGPVRSARPYFIDWMLPYNAIYGHIGGSNVALQMISDLGIRDFGESAGGNTFNRLSTRFSPHNAYTNMAGIDALRASKNWENSDFTGMPRKAESPAKTLTAETIDIKLSSLYFNVRYDYDTASNSYRRSEGGTAHKDDKSGAQLSPKVVVALVVPYSIDPDGIHSDYATVGTGQAFVFQDGIYQEATWTKSAQSAQIELKDAGGRVLALNPGQTWFTAVGGSNMVTFTAPTPVVPAPTVKVGP